MSAFWDISGASRHPEPVPVDAGYTPEATLEQCRYWILLFSHNRLGIWKGMLKIDLNTPTDDAAARQDLTVRLTP